jgi:hypothetical protein
VCVPCVLRESAELVSGDDSVAITSTADQDLIARVQTTVPRGYEVKLGTEYQWRIVARDRGAGYERRSIRYKAGGYEVSVARRYVGRAKTEAEAITLHDVALREHYDEIPEVNLRRVLRDLGLLGLRHERKFIPRLYMENSPAVRMELLRGLMDTDGSPNHGNSAIIEQTSARLGEDIQELTRSLGGLCRLIKSPPRNERWKTSYRANLRYHDVENLFWLPRKKKKRNPRTGVVRKVTSIEPVGRAEVQCIAVDHPGGLYVTDDWIVTHSKTGKTALIAAVG